MRHPILKWPFIPYKFILIFRKFENASDYLFAESVLFSGFEHSFVGYIPIAFAQEPNSMWPLFSINLTSIKLFFLDLGLLYLLEILVKLQEMKVFLYPMPFFLVIFKFDRFD